MVGIIAAIVLRVRPPGPELEIREYTITLKQDAKLTATPGVCLMPGINWSLKEGQLNHIAYFTPEHVPVVECPTRESGAQVYNLTVTPGEYVGEYPMCTAVYALDSPLYASVARNPVEPCYTLLQVGVGKTGEKLAKGTTIHKRFAVLRLPFASEGEYTWLPEYKRYWNSNLLMEDLRQKMGLAGPPAYRITSNVGRVLDTKLALRLKADTFGFRGQIAKCHLPIGLPVLIEGLNPRWSAGVWYKGANTLLQTEWPPGFYWGTRARLHYVTERPKNDEIIRIGTFDDGIGYLQLDMETGDRDIFIGNLVTCSRDDFFLVFHRDLTTGKGTVEVHNPTDKPARVTVKPGKGFDLFGDFSQNVAVPAGSSTMIGIP